MNNRLLWPWGHHRPTSHCPVWCKKFLLQLVIVFCLSSGRVNMINTESTCCLTGTTRGHWCRVSCLRHGLVLL